MAHHVVARCVSGHRLFLDDHDYARYLALIARETRDRGWRIFSYCLMPNHVHLLLRTPDGDLGAGVGRVHGAFARHANRRQERHGHLFGERFHNRLVQDDQHFLACLRYIARNPVAAGLTETASAWRWTAHRALSGAEAAGPILRVEEALAFFDVPTPRGAYIDLVDRSDAEVLADLKAARPGETWVKEAVDHFGMTPAAIGDALGVSRTVVYRRLAAARLDANPKVGLR